MADGAADLVDQILPQVADYRQWPLSFPRWLRDKAVVSEVLVVFVRVDSASGTCCPPPTTNNPASSPRAPRSPSWWPGSLDDVALRGSRS